MLLFSPNKPVLCMRLYLSLHAPLCFVLGFFGSYKKTSETLSTAGQRTSAAFSTFGSTITRKIGDMRYRLMVTCSLNFLLHTCQTALTVTVVVCKPCGHSHPMNLVVLWTHGVAFCDTRSANGFKHRLDKLFQMSKVILPLQWSMFAK